jgi:hypothetical protein
LTLTPSCVPVAALAPGRAGQFLGRGLHIRFEDAIAEQHGEHGGEGVRQACVGFDEEPVVDDAADGN